MPSHQCHLNAERCLRLAKRARRSAMRENLMALAEAWTKLAAQLESDEALLDALSKLEINEPMDDLVVALKLHSWPKRSTERRPIIASRRPW